MATNLTPQQQARVDVAGKAVVDASISFSTASDMAEAAAQAASQCQAARDTKSTGIGKNNACHIDTLTRLNADWADKVNRRNAFQALYEDAKRNYDNVLAQVAKEQALSLEALKNDPAYNLQTQANIIESDRLQNESEAQNNKKKVVIVGIIVLALIIFVSLFIYFKKNKNA